MNAPHWHVLGAGAIGCLFATALQRSGAATTLVLRQRIASNSSVVAVERQDTAEKFRLPVFSPDDGTVISHLLVTTKAYDVVDAVAGIADHLAADCSLLLLVNGMGLAEQLQARWPWLTVYCGTTTEGAYTLSPQHIRHAGRGETRIGCQGQQQPAAWFSQWHEAIDACYWDSDIEAALWSKLAVNCVINPLTALHNCPNGELTRRTELAHRVTALCDEVAQVAAAAGFSQVAGDLHQKVAAVISGTADNRSSMLQDIDSGRPTEIDYISGYLIQVAADHGIDVPHNRALLEKIKNMLAEALPLSTVLPPVGLCCAAVIALVISDFRNFRAGRYLFKPLAAAAFVWLALSLDATATTYGSWILAALLLCMLGDLFLMPDDKRSFLAGLTSFLCGHLLFAVAFLQLPHSSTGLALSVVPALILLLGVRRWLTPHVEAAMKIPVALYVVVITGMLLCAGLTAGQPAAAFIIGGAWGFACSDLAVARRQFVHPSPFNGLWGTPLYFFSQLVLACSVALV